MKLPPGGVDYYRPRPSTTPTVDPGDWVCSFDGGATFINATVLTDLIDDGEPAWLVANAATVAPDPTAAVMPDAQWTIPGLGFGSPPVNVVRPGPPIYLT